MDRCLIYLDEQIERTDVYAMKWTDRELNGQIGDLMDILTRHQIYR